MKKILVTGGAGFIGSNLIKKLVSLNYKVYSIDNYSTGSKSNEIIGATYLNMDIENINEIDVSFDLCFHLAAKTLVQNSFKNSAEYFKVNVEGTLQVLEWAAKKKVKIIYAGSSSKHHEPSDSPYAMYKFLGEELCKLYKNSFSVNVEIARFYNVYGPNERIDEKYGNVIGIWIYKIINSKPLTVVGDGEQRRDFIHVFDIVDGLIKIGFSDKKNIDAWELGLGINYSINELLTMFMTKFNTRYIKVPDQKGNYRLTLRVNDDMLKNFNWLPKDRLKDHIENLNI